MAKQSCFRLKQYVLICFMFLVTLDGNLVHGISDIAMGNYCDQEISMILKSVYQAQVSLFVQPSFPHRFSSTNNSVCDTRIEAWYNKPNLMFYIDHLDLDCDDGYLQFYDGYSSSRVNLNPYLDLQNVCGPNYPSSVYTTESRYLRIKYIPRKQKYISDALRLIVTAYSEGKSCESYEYTCENKRCIDDETACNGFNSCGDNSSCRLSTAAIVGIVIGALAGVGLIVSIIVCVVCATKKSRGRQGTTHNIGFQQQPVVYNPNMQQPIGYGAPPPIQTQYGIPPTTYGQPPTNNPYPTQPNNLYPTQALTTTQVTATT